MVTNPGPGGASPPCRCATSTTSTISTISTTSGTVDGMTTREVRLDIDGMPVVCVEPASAARGTAVWVTHLGGSAEQARPMLERLAGHGFAAATFDPPGHGSRGTGDPWEMAAAVLASFRRRMWPLLGQTVLESLRVQDWLAATYPGVGDRVAGGVSMGGDVAVALAGVDARVTRVASLVATPDWARPGMRVLDDPDTVLDQGDADAYARFFYEALDPMTHLERYERDLEILFEMGGDDHHVPWPNAVAFRDALATRGASSRAAVRVEVVAGLDHLAAARDERLYDAALAWLSR